MTLVAAASLVAGAAIAVAPSANAAKTVTLAFQGPLTGGDAQLGQDQLPGAKYAIYLYNKSKPKVKVNLIEADDQCDGTVAANIAPGVASNANVVGVIGASCSGGSVASFPSYIKAGLPMISPSASRVSLTDPKSSDSGAPIFHRTVASDKFQGPALARYATKGVKSPKIYLVDDITPYGAGLIEYTKPTAAKLGSVVGTDSVPKGTADFTSVASKVAGKGANVVIYGGYQQDAAKFVKALRDGGYKGVFAAGDGVNVSDFPGLAGAAGEGVRLTAADVPFDRLVSKKTLKDFTKATKIKVPGLYVTTTFDATNAFLDCIKAGNTTRSDINVCISGTTFKSVSGGKIDFDRFGDNSNGAPVGAYLVEKGVIKYKAVA